MTAAPAPKGIVAVVGVGPRLGRSIARKFAHEGYTVAILARDLGKLSRFADEIAREEKGQVFAIRIDCSDPKSVREAFEGVLSLGFVEVLVYNACAPHPPHAQGSNFQNVSLESFENALAVSAVGAFQCAQSVIPGMVERRRGTILFTGSSVSLRGLPGHCELSCGKFALRGLSQCLADEFQPQGIHVAHIVIDGSVRPPGYSESSSSTRGAVAGAGAEAASESEGLMDPDALAQTYWHIHFQDKSAWTREIDLRSYSCH
ncbi:hypothetical protein AMTRI_Chr04g184040 [Amborella trichopoda]|uniref:Uncharacterized protein n=1 Tax=Amborella trichopoda TaxID=13333 RepID=W1NPF4_AMBTC|nr:uncharacterized protein LOC18424769 [Amborella trichopoda]ERM96825.1 hypothetical protein AMTR_s00128p00079640 [Amborella trichopoda]|eukprot:XP_006829409.1 uncharacterized protein LOC18424769 [Amborella trichopoda]